jgi:hypothetical protein
MARLPRATFALMLALLPAAATAIGLVVLGQVPTFQDLLGISLVIIGVALHHDPTVAVSRHIQAAKGVPAVELHTLRHTETRDQPALGSSVPRIGVGGSQHQ